MILAVNGIEFRYASRTILENVGFSVLRGNSYQSSGTMALENRRCSRP